MIHTKDCNEWWSNILYIQKKRHTTNHEYWNILTIWLFNVLVFETILQHGFRFHRY